jgi:PAS domain S-box-containing protein
MTAVAAPLRRRRVVIWTVAVLVAAGVGMAVWAWFVREPGWEGPLRAGFRDSPPFYYAAADGRPEGLAVDVLTAAARRSGVPLSWVKLDGSSSAALQGNRIDVWPTMPLANRTDPFHVTDPWLEGSYFLAFPAGSPLRGVPDTVGRIVTLFRDRGEDEAVARTLPGVIPLFIGSSGEKLQLVCRGRAAAAFVEGREGQALLLKRPPGCESVALEFMRVDGTTVAYGVGSTFRAAGVADRLRRELGRMAEDGELARIHARWSITTADEVRLVQAIQAVRLRSQVSIAGVAVLAIALAGAIWLAVRSRQSQRLAEAYAHEQERYRRLFERNLAGVFRSTADGQIIDCNDAFARMLGCPSRVDLLSRQAWDFYPDRAAREAMLALLERQGILANHELTLRRVDGSQVILLESVSFVDGANGEARILEGTVVDITRQRELEDQYRQAQKLESIGRLAGGVAHDFNNTLTAINGYTELILSSVDPADPNHAMLQHVRKAGQHAESLTRQLLAFSRRQHLQPTVINLNLVVAELRNLVQRVIGEDIALEFDLSPDLASVRADQDQIQQVIMNLAANARDAMPDGGHLTVATATVAITEDALPEPGVAPGVYCRLTVTDTGEGMTAEHRMRVFEPFFTTKERGKGTGLGLSTVYGIVKQSGGHIRVRSQSGAGTSFEIDLPAVAEVAEATMRSRPDAAPCGTETVLVAEDQADVRRLVRDALTRSGYTVLDAGDGEAALTLCRDHAGPIDLLITDVVMPGMTGPVVAARCRDLRPHIKVLFMSGYTHNILRGVTDPGMPTAYIQKPFTPVQLGTKIREVLES